MLKIVKSGSVVVSDDVYTIKEQIPRIALPTEAEAPPEDNLQLNSEEAGNLIIQKAAADAKRTLESAAAQAEAERMEILAKAGQEAELVKMRAYEEGLRESLEERRRTIGECVAQLEQLVSRIEGEQAGFFSEFESNLRWLALEIASRILNQRIGEDDLAAKSLIKAAMSTVKNAEWISVELSEKMAGLIDHLTQEVQQLGDDHIQIRGVDAPMGTCVVDTPTERIDASVYTQLSNLKEYFSRENE